VKVTVASMADAVHVDLCNESWNLPRYCPKDRGWKQRPMF